MIFSLLIKMLMTAIVVIVVTLLVGRLGSRVGGIIAGMPIVIGPAFYFLAREQTSEFVARAAVSNLYALTASLLYLMCFVCVAARLGAITSVLLGVSIWIVASVLFVQLSVGLWAALCLYSLIFVLALLLERRLNLVQQRPKTRVRWVDLFLRGIAAGIIVGVATTVAAQHGPVISGTLAGFPVGFTIISLTLYQRYGAPVARATLVTTQRGMLSLAVFSLVIAVAAPVLGGMGAFFPALVASLLVSALMASVAARHSTAVS